MVVMAGWLLRMFLTKSWFQNNYPRLAQSIIVKSMTWCTYVWVVLKCFDFQDSFKKLCSYHVPGSGRRPGRHDLLKYWSLGREVQHRITSLCCCFTNYIVLSYCDMFTVSLSVWRTRSWSHVVRITITCYWRCPSTGAVMPPPPRPPHHLTLYSAQLFTSKHSTTSSDPVCKLTGTAPEPARITMSQILEQDWSAWARLVNTVWPGVLVWENWAPAGDGRMNQGKQEKVTWTTTDNLYEMLIL